MADQIFIDTSAFFAPLRKKDENHEKSKNIWNDLRKSKSKLYTSEFVIFETVTLIRTKIGIEDSINFKKMVYALKTIELFYVNRKTIDNAWRIFEQHADKKYSFVDCAVNANMTDQDIKKIYTFDGHFEQMGFEIVN